MRYAFHRCLLPRKTCFIQIGFCDFASLFYRRRTSVNRATRFLRESRIISSLIPSTPKSPSFPVLSCVFPCRKHRVHKRVLPFFRQRLFYIVSYFKAGTVGIGQNNNSPFRPPSFYAFQYSVSSENTQNPFVTIITASIKRDSFILSYIPRQQSFLYFVHNK